MNCSTVGVRKCGNLNYHSVLQIWVCEFCGTENEVEIVPEEMPTKDDTTYMIAPAPVVGGGAVGGASVEDSLVIFCIDVSGSMCVTTEVSPRVIVHVFIHVN